MNNQPVQIYKPSRNELRLIFDLAFGASRTEIGQAAVRNTVLYHEAMWEQEDKRTADAAAQAQARADAEAKAKAESESKAKLEAEILAQLEAKAIVQVDVVDQASAVVEKANAVPDVVERNGDYTSSPKPPKAK